ncbi:MAG: 50S ribosomal protein L30 [Gammaproteobacteria bacterium RIFOXYB2_FULL_38_6]|nr:MAG: 50S ribosomal protein L30 [Gammaproteobacteria bacterium RIFOXYB2_FULL_38_6]
MAEKKLKVTLIKSKHGRKAGHLECIQGLGLKRIRQTVILKDTPEVRGMIEKIFYLLKVENS